MMFSDDSEEEERKSCGKVHGELRHMKEKKDCQSDRQRTSNVGYTQSSKGGGESERRRERSIRLTMLEEFESSLCVPLLSL